MERDSLAAGPQPAAGQPGPGSRVEREVTKEEFLRRMLGEMSATIQDVAGTEQASSYFASVGSLIGDWVNSVYHKDIGTADFDIEQLGRIFMDLQSRIDGGFVVVSVEPDRIVLRNNRCPFGKHIQGRPSMCMMTSNILGKIAAENCGYARVTLQRTLAQESGTCDVVVSLGKEAPVGRNTHEYFKVADLPDDGHG